MGDTDEVELVAGRATPEGTNRFRGRFPDRPGHFRAPDHLQFSSLALGLRRGDVGGVDDLLYRSAVAECLENGVNVFDTALSDRYQTSERALGHALRRAFIEEIAARDEVIVISKGGELVPDPEVAGGYGAAERYLRRTYLESGLIDPAFLNRGNALDPNFLRDQIGRSRRNLGLETIDFYLLQEPEIHLRSLGPSGFHEQVARVFEMLEDAVRDGVIGAYGVCSWDGFLIPDSDRAHLSLMDLFEIALEVGSADHHLRAIQLPYGLAMGEGAVLTSQLGPDGHTKSLLDTLRNTGTAVLASAPLYGGRLLRRIPEFVRKSFPEAQSDAQCAIQFVRSTPNVTSAVVGMREPDHLDENLALTRTPPADPRIPLGLFAAASQRSP